jgi:hypothetical protein
MTSFFIEHWPQIAGAVTALSGALAGLWRLRVGGWMRDRVTLEIDLIECRRRSEHREALLADLLSEIDYLKQWRDGSERSHSDTTRPPTRPRKRSSP